MVCFQIFSRQHPARLHQIPRLENRRQILVTGAGDTHLMLQVPLVGCYDGRGELGPPRHQQLPAASVCVPLVRQRQVHLWLEVCVQEQQLVCVQKEALCFTVSQSAISEDCEIPCGDPAATTTQTCAPKSVE